MSIQDFVNANEIQCQMAEIPPPIALSPNNPLLWHGHLLMKLAVCNWVEEVKDKCSAQIAQLETLKPHLPKSLAEIVAEILNCLSVRFPSDPETARMLYLYCLQSIQKLKRTLEIHPHHDLLENINSLCQKLLVGLEARVVHDIAMDPYLDFAFETMGEMELANVLDSVPKTLQSPLLTRVALSWELCQQSSSSLCFDEVEDLNLPNHSFSLHLPNRTTRVFRMPTPVFHTDSLQIDPIYRGFLDHCQSSGLRHIDLCMQSRTDPSSDFQMEIVSSQLRFDLGRDYPKALRALSFDLYSDFCWGAPGKEGSLESIRTEFLSRLFSCDYPELSLPESLREDEDFQAQVKQHVEELHEDILHGWSGMPLTGSDWCTVVVLSMLGVLEVLCQNLSPDSLNTACSGHIDRGMLMTSVLYVYTLIKGRQIDASSAHDYLEKLIFSATLLAERRPPRKGVMKVLFSTLTRLLHPETIQKLQSRDSHFSNVSVTFPAASIQE